MSLNPIVERILSGDVPCRAEIKLYNAKRIFDWINATETHHTAETCKRSKDCVHAPGPEMLRWAQFLIEEAPTVCTCEGHKKG